MGATLWRRRDRSDHRVIRPLLPGMSQADMVRCLASLTRPWPELSNRGTMCPCLSLPRRSSCQPRQTMWTASSPRSMPTKTASFPGQRLQAILHVTACHKGMPGIFSQSATWMPTDSSTARSSVDSIRCSGRNGFFHPIRDRRRLLPSIASCSPEPRGGSPLGSWSPSSVRWPRQACALEVMI